MALGLFNFWIGVTPVYLIFLKYMTLGHHNRVLGASIIICGLLLITGLVFTYRSIQTLQDSTYWVEHTLEVMIQAEEITSEANEIRLAGRSYRISGDEKFLESLPERELSIQSHMELLRQLTRDNTDQQPQIDSLATAIARRISFAENYASASRQLGFEKASAAYTLDEAVQKEKRIFYWMNLIRTAEQHLLTARRETSIESVHTVDRILTGLAICLAFSAVILFWGMRSNTTLQRKISEHNEYLENTLKEVSDYKYALDQSSIVAITDQRGTIKHINDNFVAISKYSREELLGQDHCIVNSQYHPKEFIRNLWHTIASGKVWRGELRNRAKNGSLYWVDTTIVPFLNENGRPYQYVAIRADITNRKKAEDELVKVNRLYLFLSAINQSIVHIKDQQTLLKNVCSIALEIGKFESALIGILDERDRLIVINPDKAGAPVGIQKFSGHNFKEPPLNNSPTGKVLSSGKRYVSNDAREDSGLTPWRQDIERSNVNAVASFPIKKFNQTIGVFSFLSSEKGFFDEKEVALLEEAAGDISFALEVFDKEEERQTGKEKLENSQANLNAIIENTDATIYSLDRNFRYTAFNHLLFESVKKAYNIEIKVDDNVLDFLKKLAPEEARKWEDIYTQAFNGETVKFEREFKINNYHSYTSFSIHPIWENNSVIGLSCFVNDISKQKEDERHKARMTSDLIERNADLEQFSYIVSHNLRAPVANILGIADLIKNNYVREGEGPKVQEHLFKAVDQLDVVISDLNRILQIKREVNERKEIVSFNELVDTLKSSIQNLIEKEQVKIVTDFSAAESMVTIRTYLQSIFYNLISNGIKYARPGEPPIITITSETTKNGLILKFRDNGMGIDLEQHGGNVFRLYKRFHLEIEGKGVGLFMVKTQVETLGGKISIKSEVNTGTEFRIEFESAD